MRYKIFWGYNFYLRNFQTKKSHSFFPCFPPHFSSLTRRLFSVALSLRLPSLDVIQHLCSMEPGLSSYAVFRLCYTRLFNLLIYYCTIKYPLRQIFYYCFFRNVSLTFYVAQYRNSKKILVGNLEPLWGRYQNFS